MLGGEGSISRPAFLDFYMDFPSRQNEKGNWISLPVPFPSLPVNTPAYYHNQTNKQKSRTSGVHYQLGISHFHQVVVLLLFSLNKQTVVTSTELIIQQNHQWSLRFKCFNLWKIFKMSSLLSLCKVKPPLDKYCSLVAETWLHQHIFGQLVAGP